MLIKSAEEDDADFLLLTSVFLLSSEIFLYSSPVVLFMAKGEKASYSTGGSELGQPNVCLFLPIARTQLLMSQQLLNVVTPGM